MRPLSYLRNLLIEFLFPRNARVLELEALSTTLLLETLPRAEPPKDKHTLALFDYSHPLVKEMIWELKYKGNVRIAEKLGEILYDTLQHELSDLALFESAGWQNTRPILVPVPISDKRRFERGWNQSELLAQALKKYDTGEAFKYLPRQLAKVLHTESQTKTGSRSERLKNLADSMRVINESTVAGRSVIVLDDVTTTGSTFAEARRALRQAGAKKILCVAIAH